MSKLIPSVASLLAVANWNVQRALDLLRWEPHEKNHDRSKAMLSDAGRHFRNADFARLWAKTLTDKAAEAKTMASSPFAVLVNHTQEAKCS
jgi:hypothetical protein